MATQEATRYAGRYVKDVKQEPGAIFMSPRELRKAIAKAYDAGSGVAPFPKRSAILEAFWNAITDGTKFVDMSEGMDIEFYLDGTFFVVNTAAGPDLHTGEKQSYRSYLEKRVVAQVRSVLRPAPAPAVSDGLP